MWKHSADLTYKLKIHNQMKLWKVNSIISPYWSAENFHITKMFSIEDTAEIYPDLNRFHCNVILKKGFITKPKHAGQ